MNISQPRRLRSATVTALVQISVLASAATLLALAARWWWPFELLSHFRVQYIWLLTPLTVGLLVAKRYPVAVLTCGCLIWNLALVAPDYFGSQAVVEGSSQLRIMSANVLTSNRDFERFLGTVREANPDVLLVMEIDVSWVPAFRSTMCWCRTESM